ncbi:MAG TPA: histidinol dehydrogenase [Dongiaceae bacterium]|jgi:histidinol dehydrogenase|nr:histidinol dehydrogenase [Dongiaceae bacterium]
MTTIRFIELAKLSVSERAQLLQRTESDLGPYIDKARPVVEAVRREGDEALARFAREFDHAPLSADRIAATKADIDRAVDSLERKLTEAIEFAIDSIRRFHEAQLPQKLWMKELRAGVFTGERATPIDSVACYVPRGKGAFPSVAMMTAVPAVVAGVPQISILTPCGPDAHVDAATLAVARLAGVSGIYKCGGAAAVAAAAFGTATVPKALKIVGPGSPYHVAAKRLLADAIDPGIPAGPSESIVLADDSADGWQAALDLIIESEHGADSSAYLVTPSRKVAEAAIAALPQHWGQMGEQRRGYSAAVLGGPRGGIVLAPDMDSAYAFVNDYAPEHLLILGREPFAHMDHIRNAGEILLGSHTPFTLGNFVLGPNAVLPTSGAARTVSPLSVHDFMKRTGVGYVTEAGYSTLAPMAETLARYEGFEGHANAVSAWRKSRG